MLPLVALASLTKGAHEASGPTVTIISTIDSGGLTQSSPSTEIVGFVGPLGTVATNSSGSIAVRSGPVGMVVFPTGFSVESSALTINEAGSSPEESTRAQLVGLAVNDDETKDTVSPASVTWTQPGANSALSSISPDGVVSAAAVFQNTAATFTGSYAGIAASSSLTVLNVLNDNFGAIAGDTFDDAWQVAKGITNFLDPNALTHGKPNWMLYALDTDPGSSAGALVTIDRDMGGYLTITHTRNPRATGYSFAVEEASILSTGFAPLVNPVSQTNTTQSGSISVTTRGSVPISAAPRQFLRVRVTKTQ